MTRTIQDILYIFPQTKESDWKQHPNGGGWCQITAKIDATVFIGGNVIISGNAWVYGNALVTAGGELVKYTREFKINAASRAAQLTNPTPIAMWSAKGDQLLDALSAAVEQAKREGKG